MSKIFIHVGLHKTASTFLQDIVFPTLENTTLVSRPYSQLNHAFNKLQYADETRFDEYEFKEEFSKIEQIGKNVLISDEMLSGVPNFNYINRSMIANRLHHFFPDATILLFLRSQRDLIRALHNSWIRNINGTRRIESFVCFPEKNYSFAQYDPHKVKNAGFVEFEANRNAYYFNHDAFSLNLSNFFYFEVVNLYRKLFENVHVFLFEDFRSNPMAVVDQLEHIIGDRFVGITQERLSQPVNTSMTEAELEGQRFRNLGQEITQNRLILKAFEMSGRLSHNLFHRDTNQQFLTRRLQDFYVENNRKLMQAYPEIRLDKYPDKYQF